MLGYHADKALIYGLMRSVGQCLSLCLESIATGPCSQHIERFKMLEYMKEKIYNIKVLLNNLICVIEVDDYGKK